MRLYWTYRSKRIVNPFVLEQNTSLNGVYTPSFFLSNQFADYEKAGLTKTLDMEIPEERYTAELVPWVPKLTRFIVGEYNEAYVNGVDFANSIAKVGAEFQIDVFATNQEAITWILANTNLIEETPWNFLIHPEYTEITGEIVPEKYLTIV